MTCRPVTLDPEFADHVAWLRRQAMRLVQLPRPASTPPQLPTSCPAEPPTAVAWTARCPCGPHDTTWTQTRGRAPTPRACAAVTGRLP